MGERFVERMRDERAGVVSREAARVLAEDGCFRLRVEDVARAAGVAKGTVYLDLGSKEHLIAASLAGQCFEMLEALASRVEPIADRGERLREAIRFLARVPVDQPDLVVLLEGRLPCAARWIGADVSPYQRIEGFLATLIEDAVRAGDLDSGIDPRFAAQAVLAVASTPEWRRLAATDGPDPVERQMACLMPSLLSRGRLEGRGQRVASLRRHS